jgi:hypothetical protein
MVTHSETKIINESQLIVTIRVGEGMSRHLMPGEDILIPDTPTALAPYVRRPTIHITDAQELKDTG